MEREFIWYCPCSGCNNILLKTEKPILEVEKEFRCKRCNDIYGAKTIMKKNKHNIKKHIQILEESEE